jgi:hypothetical protein
VGRVAQIALYTLGWPHTARPLEPVLGGVAVTPTCFSGLGGLLQTYLFSTLKFVECWFLEERNPWFHQIFGNVETCLRKL